MRHVLLGLALSSLLPLSACDEKKEDPPAAAPPPASATATPEAPSAAASPTTMTTTTAAAPAPPPESVAAQHVLVAWRGAKNAAKTVTRSKADAKKRADEIVAKAKGGADFSALVTEYSDDEATKDRRGSLGKFTKEKMTPAFADAAFALAVDEVSAPVETPFGYHVIKRNQ